MSEILRSNNEYKQQLLADFNSRTNYEQGKFYAPVGNRLIEIANLQNGQKILDVATGTGIIAFATAKIVGEQGEVIGVDISSGMLANAKKKLAIYDLQNIKFIEADAEFLDFICVDFNKLLNLKVQLL